MNVEDNIKVIDAVDRAVNTRDWKAFDEKHSQNVLAYSPLTEEPTKGIEEHREAVRGLTISFPDFHIKTERCFGQGEWLCTEFIITGTHKAPLKSDGGQVIPPTNKKLRLPLISIMKIKDGKIVEERTYYDRLTMLAQLGIQPR